jgi:hypothetical protein
VRGTTFEGVFLCFLKELKYFFLQSIILFKKWPYPTLHHLQRSCYELKVFCCIKWRNNLGWNVFWKCYELAFFFWCYLCLQ